MFTTRNIRSYVEQPDGLLTHVDTDGSVLRADVEPVDAVFDPDVDVFGLAIWSPRCGPLGVAGWDLTVALDDPDAQDDDWFWDVDGSDVEEAVRRALALLDGLDAERVGG